MDTRFETFLTFPADEMALRPSDQSTPRWTEAGQTPLVGDFIRLAPRSVWQVQARCWEQPEPEVLRLHLWVIHAPDALPLLQPPSPKLVPLAPPIASDAR